MTSEDLMRTQRAELELPCRRYAVRRLRLFGSAVRGEFDPQRGIETESSRQKAQARVQHAEQAASTSRRVRSHPP
jgi:hypothetical protein